jgi:hypothetical protein
MTVINYGGIQDDRPHQTLFRVNPPTQKGQGRPNKRFEKPEVSRIKI